MYLGMEGVGQDKRVRVINSHAYWQGSYRAHSCAGLSNCTCVITTALLFQSVAGTRNEKLAETTARNKAEKSKNVLPVSPVLPKRATLFQFLILVYCFQPNPVRGRVESLSFILFSCSRTCSLALAFSRSTYGSVGITLHRPITENPDSCCSLPILVLSHGV